MELLEINGLVLLRGDFPVHDNDCNEVAHYRLEIWFPNDYPDQIPKVMAIDKRIQPIADRHVFSNRAACLCLPHEVSRHLPKINFEFLWEKLLKFWLIGQAYYDRNGEWPFKARSHDATGIYEGFSELLDISNKDAVKRFTLLLIRKNVAKGHEPCPCGSGKRLRSCHRKLYNEIRSLLPENVMSVYRKFLSS